jgi:hypothetical protein
VWSCVCEFNVHVYAELMSVIDSAERQVGNMPAVLQVLCTAGGVLYGHALDGSGLTRHRLSSGCSLSVSRTAMGQPRMVGYRSWGCAVWACTRWQRSHASPSIEWVLTQCVQTPEGQGPLSDLFGGWCCRCHREPLDWFQTVFGLRDLVWLF